MKGADRGPEAIIEASANMELYDIETDSEVYRKGIYLAKPVTEDSEPKKMVCAVYDKVNQYIKENKFVILIGGEHSVSIGSVIAHSENYRDLTILQLDAHADLRPQYEGSIYNHACVMSRVAEICPYVQVGIRSMDISEKQFIHKENIFYAHNIIEDPEWINKVVGLLKGNVYITLDLDVFDPSVMPSTGTPEPGGLYWYDIIKLLKKVSEKVNIVGFDIVELCPDDSNKAPDFLAAKLIYKLLSYIYFNK
jgi:agmatinase